MIFVKQPVQSTAPPAHVDDEMSVERGDDADQDRHRTKVAAFYEGNLGLRATGLAGQIYLAPAASPPEGAYDPPNTLAVHRAIIAAALISGLTRIERMNVSFVAGFGPIVRDGEASISLLGEGREADQSGKQD